MNILKEFNYNNEKVVLVRKADLAPENVVKENTGCNNTGDRNTGDRNTGDRNTGDRNTGGWNTGDWSTGDWNTGDSNTGDRNTGGRNTGDRNTGDRNTGGWNTGGWNTGGRNTGDRNTGDWNTGDWNTGDWNTGDWNTGYFNTDSLKVRLFNQQTNISHRDFDFNIFPDFLYFNLTKWIDEENMTEDEKTEYPEAHVTGGYLKAYGYQEAFKMSWDNASRDEQLKMLEVPNFDADIFKEISGIDVIKDMKNA